jgi:3-oxoacyl-[acyl-carrier protein] reductase
LEFKDREGPVNEPKSALVTGASRGIGLGIASRLAKQGYALTVTGRDGERLKAVSRSLAELGAADVRTVVADMANEDDVIGVVDAHASAYGDMTVLVLAAGVGSAGPIADYPLGRYDKQFAVNTRGAFVVIARSLPLLRKAASTYPDRGSRIVALASIGGVYAEKSLAVYGAAKAALISLCHSVNVEESGNGVCATAIAPGYVDTDMTAWIHEEVPPETMIAVSDIVELVDGLLRLSPRAVVPKLVVSRAATSGYCA